MKLFIAEKPSVAKCIVDSLGLKKKESGYYVAKNGDLITWCFGHLLELAPPDFYLDDSVPMNKSGKGKVWRDKDLPIFPPRWKNQPKSDSGAKKQLSVIKQLLKKCDVAVNCGDPDREGQLLVDEILEFYGFKKKTLRYWSSAQDASSVKKALSSLKSNDQFHGMANAARGRQRADWLIGMNLSRAYTLAAGRGKKGSLMSVGRVQTPTLNLVANRDLEIKNFKPVAFYKLKANLSFKGVGFTAALQLPKTFNGLDSEGRLVNKTVASEILAKLKQASSCSVTDVDNKKVELEHPKSLSLADIQNEASSRWGYSAKEALDVCQSLYEVHKLTTYPRSDCPYLPEVQHAEAASVLSVLKVVNPKFESYINQADTSIKSSTWNDKKITAHHGIIPTMHKGDASKLTEKERNIYELIVRRYIAQFLPKCLMSKAKYKFNIQGYEFVASGSAVLKQGFKAVLKNIEKDDDNKEDGSQNLPSCAVGDTIPITRIDCIADKTKPPQSFNEGTLIRAMENIASVVDNPDHKKLLREDDGIGTSATRAAIIEELKRKGYLETKGKFLKTTDLGFKLLKSLPEMIKNPVLTALFESKLKDIEAGKLSLIKFEGDNVRTFVSSEVAKAKKMTIN